MIKIKLIMIKVIKILQNQCDHYKLIKIKVINVNLIIIKVSNWVKSKWLISKWTNSKWSNKMIKLDKINMIKFKGIKIKVIKFQFGSFSTETNYFFQLVNKNILCTKSYILKLFWAWQNVERWSTCCFHLLLNNIHCRCHPLKPSRY